MVTVVLSGTTDTEVTTVTTGTLSTKVGEVPAMTMGTTSTGDAKVTGAPAVTLGDHRDARRARRRPGDQLQSARDVRAHSSREDALTNARRHREL